MSKVKSIVAAALTLAAVGSAAKAAVFTQTVGNVTITVTPVAVNPSNDFGETATGYTAYLVQASSANNITAVAAAGTGAATETGFTGPMLQEDDYVVSRGTKKVTLTPTMSVATGEANSDYSLDSHFLIPANGLTAAPGFAPTEDNSSAVLTGPQSTAVGAPAADGFDEWGNGTSLTGAYALGTGTTHSLDLAWLVIPTGSTVAYDFNIFTDVTSANGAQFDGVIPTGTVNTPEPASLGVLALGGVALLRRRKAKSVK